MQPSCQTRRPHLNIVFIVSSIALLILVVACGQDRPSAEARELLLQGARHRLNGEPVRALDAYTKAIADSPGYADAYLERADTLGELGRKGEAARDYSKALELDDSLAGTVYVNRGVMQMGAGDYARAIQDFDRALKLEPDDASTLSNRGLARARSGDLAGGLADLDASISIANSNSIAYSTRALIRALAGEHEGSLQDYGRAIQLRPYDSALLFQRSLVLIETGSLQQALEDLDQAIAVETENAQLYVVRARVRRDLGQIDGADADARKAKGLGADPNSVLSPGESALSPVP